MKKALRILVGLLLFIILALTLSYLVSGGPTVISNRVVIQKPQETVFDFVADMRNELKWNPDVQLMQKITADSIGAGTRFRAKWHMSDTILVEIVRYERPQAVTFVNGGPLEVRLELNLTPSGNETAMDTRFIVTPHGFLRAIFPIMKGQLAAQEAENMVNLKKALEAGN